MGLVARESYSFASFFRAQDLPFSVQELRESLLLSNLRRDSVFNPPHVQITKATGPFETA